MVDEYYSDAVTLETATTVAVSAGGATPANATLACESAGCPVKTGTPTVSGTAAVGQTLTVNPGKWTPANAALTYRWFREFDDGQQAIVGATGTTYKVRPADVGAVLVVRVKGSATGWQTRSAWSGSTAVVVESVPVPPKPKPKPVAASVSVSAKGAKKSATFTITVRASGRTPTGTVTIKLGAKRLKTVALRGGKAKVKVTKQKKGRKTYTIVYSGGGGVAAKSVAKSVKIK